ncbi:DUF4332 domain-containing protein [Eubacteriaceae bacterium ES2]|nr:DUF4332 domain-containing protein [Eubacteriaceae bacterium ES2]
MSYYKELRSISLHDYKAMLLEMNLIKSRLILRENIDERFAIIKNQGISDLEQLTCVLKSKKKKEQFAEISGIDLDYLTVLIREVNSLHPKPNLLRDLPCIDEQVAEGLEAAGYKDTYSIYELVKDKSKCQKIVDRFSLSNDTMGMIINYADISRIRWVNHTFAYILIKVGYDCVEKIANADCNQLYRMIKAANEEEQIYKGRIGLNDIEILIEWADWTYRQDTAGNIDLDD